MTLDHGGYLSSPIPDWLHQVIKLGTYPTTRGLGGTARKNLSRSTHASGRLTKLGQQVLAGAPCKAELL